MLTRKRGSKTIAEFFAKNGGLMRLSGFEADRSVEVPPPGDRGRNGLGIDDHINTINEAAA